MKLEIITNHNLDKNVVRNILIEEANKSKEKYKNELKNLEIFWNEDKFDVNFTVMGMKFKGYGEIQTNKLISNLELSGAAKLFHQNIKRSLENKLNQILS